MSLKELTSEKHKQAESTPFMKAIFNGKLPIDLWIDWTYQKLHFYSVLEGTADSCNLLNDLPDIRRAYYLFQDYTEMNKDKKRYVQRPIVKEYVCYIQSLADEPNRVMAHVYTWHMGDLFGGQMIKKIVKGSHHSLDFKDPQTLMKNIREKLNIDMGNEANVAFEWAIKMMKDYDGDLGQD
jgi:heme oxygenase